MPCEASAFCEVSPDELGHPLSIALLSEKPEGCALKKLLKHCACMTVWEEVPISTLVEDYKEKRMDLMYKPLITTAPPQLSPYSNLSV